MSFFQTGPAQSLRTQKQSEKPVHSLYMQKVVPPHSVLVTVSGHLQNNFGEFRGQRA